MIDAPDATQQLAEATVIARFGVNLYVANRIVRCRVDVATEWLSPGQQCITQDLRHFECDCGETFTLDLMASKAEVKQWLRATAGNSQPSETSLIYADTDLSLPPCKHWSHISL